jgi:uncharacterized protein involved in response to NO
MSTLRSHFATFSAAPHRMFFFGGMLQTVLTVVWWLVDLGGRYGGWYSPVAWSMSPLDAHALLMIYALFPFFIFGFLMTTYPRWMNGEEVQREHYTPACLLMLAGVILFYAGLMIGASVLTAALALLLAGWAMGLYALLRVYLKAKHPDKRHATITTVVLAFGWLLLAGFASGEPHLVILAKTGGVWLLLLPVYFAVSHRMIPFFSANVIPNYTIVRPDWALTLIPGGALLHVVLELTGQLQWLWPVDLAMAAGTLYLSWAWRLRASLAVPLLAMLHIGFAWLSIALLLSATQSLVLLATGDFILGKAPLHAMVIGYFSSIVFGMATRVTLGHSGRPLAADRLTWGLFLGVQLAVVLRIVADLFPGGGHGFLAAAVVWLVCFSIWAWRLAPIYWRPRADGQPG